MGCGSSRGATVAPEQAPTKAPESQDIASQSTSSLSGSRQNVQVRQRKPRTNDALQSNSTSSLKSEADVTSLGSRNISATSGKSKGSSASGDSGLGVEHSGIITERSDQALRENAKIPEDLSKASLTIDGSAVGRRNKSRKQQIEAQPNGLKHVKFAETLINELPDSPSILKRPVSRGGMAFDVVVEDNQTPQMPVFSSHSKRKNRLTYQQLQEKQRMVEQRKKEREQMIIERIRAREERDKQVKEALEKFAEMQTELAGIKQKKHETTTQNREAYLNSLRDKLKEKSTHVEDVKTAKKVKKLTPIDRPPRASTGTIDNPINLGAN